MPGIRGGGRGPPGKLLVRGSGSETADAEVLKFFPKIDNLARKLQKLGKFYRFLAFFCHKFAQMDRKFAIFRNFHKFQQISINSLEGYDKC